MMNDEAVKRIDPDERILTDLRDGLEVGLGVVEESDEPFGG